MRIEKTVEVNGKRLRVMARTHMRRNGERACNVRILDGHYFRDLAVVDSPSLDEAVERAVAIFLGDERSSTVKKQQIVVGQTYLCKVGRQVTEVRVTGESRFGGWDAVNVKTGRSVRIKSAQRLRAPSPLSRVAARQDEGPAQGARGAKKAAKATKATKAAAGRDTAQQGAPKAQETAKSKKTGLLNAAILVMREAGQPMNTKEMVEAVLAKDLWKSDGKTPAATLYSSILREIQKKGDEARFRKTERGRFELKS